MSTFWKEHVFTVELPYEEDQPVTLFLKNHFEKVESFVMSLGQMSRIPPNKLLSYRHGKLTKTKVYANNNLYTRGLRLYLFTIPLSLARVVLDTLKALNTIDFKCDIFYAQHFLPAYLAVILRKVGILKSKKIIYYMFDFFLVPPEFPRGLYYRGIDSVQKFTRKHVDEIWYTTPRLEETDRFRFGKLPNTVEVRLVEGLFFKRIAAKKPAKIPPLKLAFLGSLRINNAVYETIDTIEACVKNNMKIELHIIGSGAEEARMKTFVKKKKLEKNIKFYGFEDRGKEIARIFSNCHLGMALYPSDAYGPNWFLTSGKFRRFISQSLPVITTNVPYLSKYVYDFNAGMVVDNNPKEVYKALASIYNDPSKLIRLNKGVDKLYNKFEAESVLLETFRPLLENMN